LNTGDEAKVVLNIKNEKREQQDNILKLWLLESIDAKLKVCVIG